MELASPKNNYHYNSQLKSFANNLRQNMTKAEACIWKYLLKGRQMKGYQFRRQRPVLKFIADFMCKDLLLIIEIDGITHDSEQGIQKDIAKDKALTEVGFTVLRFSDWEVLNRITDVSIIIGDWIDEHGKVPPPTPRQRGKS